MAPTLAHGKVCYLEIPAIDVGVSAAFYEAALGWRTRTRGDGSVAFDDGVGEVSGTWVTGRAPSAEPGLLVYVMVDHVAATLHAIVEHGGEVVQPIGGDAPEITARFRDPAGNVLGLFQQGGSRAFTVRVRVEGEIARADEGRLASLAGHLLAGGVRPSILPIAVGRGVAMAMQLQLDAESSVDAIADAERAVRAALGRLGIAEDKVHVTLALWPGSEWRGEPGLLFD
ncbi:MAG TPA: VOC family protein [Gaiellales bacterium]|jgi:hypothetical protein